MLHALLLGIALAADDPLATARAAQRAGDPAAEAAACAQVVDEGDNARGVAACSRRLAWLEARRDDDGTWTGLVLLEAARRGDAPPASIEALPDQPGISPMVVLDAELWVARQDLYAGEVDATVARTTRLWAAVEATPAAPGWREIAALHAKALARAGRMDEADAVEALLADRRSARPREGVTEERVRRRWRRVLLAARLAVGLGVAASLPFAWRARRARGRHEGLMALWVVGGGLGVLAWMRDASTAVAMTGLVVALSGHALVSAYALRGAPAGWTRAALRLVVGASALGVGALVLDHYGLLIGLLR